mmetsp:Transcript_18215/g.69067  ORF Transcript_18215/g.69067 Transcript_18215/m.69067 type:complete len:206 (+) Transcript_18215:665-1282(+)
MQRDQSGYERVQAEHRGLLLGQAAQAPAKRANRLSDPVRRTMDGEARAGSDNWQRLRRPKSDAIAGDESVVGDHRVLWLQERRWGRRTRPRRRASTYVYGARGQRNRAPRILRASCNEHSGREGVGSLLWSNHRSRRAGAHRIQRQYRRRRRQEAEEQRTDCRTECPSAGGHRLLRSPRGAALSLSRREQEDGREALCLHGHAGP